MLIVSTHIWVPVAFVALKLAWPLRWPNHRRHGDIFISVFYSSFLSCQQFHLNLSQRPTVSSGLSPTARFPPQGQTSPNQGLATYHLSQAAPLKTEFLGFSSLLFAKTKHIWQFGLSFKGRIVQNMLHGLHSDITACL